MSYPIRPAVEAAVKRLAGGIPGEGGAFIRRSPLQHFLAYPAAGQLEFQFFNVSRNRFITNLPHQGTISANTVFLAQVARCYLIPGLTTATVRAASGAAAASTLAPITNAELLRTIIMANSEVTLDLNNRQIFNVIGLHKFAAGGGAVIEGAIGTSTGNHSIANVNNGVQIAQNGYEFLPGPLAIMPVWRCA